MPAPSLSRLLTRSKPLRSLRQIHAQILTHPNLTPAATSLLLSRLLLLLSPSGPTFYLSSLFLSLPSPSLSDFNAAIRAHFPSPHPLTPLSLYSKLFSSGLRPNHLTFPFLINSCSLNRAIAAGAALHSHVFKLGFHADLFVQNNFIAMYSTCGDIDSARRVFDEMAVRDLVSENSMLVGFLRCGELDLGLVLFRKMEERNARTWNSVIAGLVQAGRAKEALGLFNEMLAGGDEGVRPDKITVASAISACASLGALDQGKWVHGYLRREGLEFDVVIGTALVDMYGKCGCLERAVEVFEEMSRRDVLAWTAMVSVLAVHGLGEEAFCLLEEMERNGMRPNHVTFGALLSACAHSGMVEKGRWCFDVMKSVYSIEPGPQHYACMVDLLGRAGLFEEAERLIGRMPMEPDEFVWGALLGACRMHGNVEVGERVAGYLIGNDPLNHAFYVILSDIYAKDNRFEDVKRVRIFMKEQGIKKPAPGCSLIEVDGQVFEFSVKGTTEDVMKEIIWVLNGLDGELKWIDYFPFDNKGVLGAT